MYKQGLGAADRPSEQVLQYALSNIKDSERLKSQDVFLWVEASLSSAQVIELVNALRHHSAEHGLENVPFGGKQVVTAGEYLPGKCRKHEAAR